MIYYGDESAEKDFNPYDALGLPSAGAATLQVNAHDGSVVDECGHGNGELDPGTGHAAVM